MILYQLFRQEKLKFFYIVFPLRCSSLSAWALYEGCKGDEIGRELAAIRLFKAILLLICIISWTRYYEFWSCTLKKKKKRFKFISTCLVKSKSIGMWFCVGMKSLNICSFGIINAITPPRPMIFPPTPTTAYKNMKTWLLLPLKPGNISIWIYSAQGNGKGCPTKGEAVHL